MLTTWFGWGISLTNSVSTFIIIDLLAVALHFVFRDRILA